MVEQLATTSMNSDLIGPPKAASAVLKRNQRQDSVVANPQRNKRKRQVQLESGKRLECSADILDKALDSPERSVYLPKK